MYVSRLLGLVGAVIYLILALVLNGGDSVYLLEPIFAWALVRNNDDFSTAKPWRRLHCYRRPHSHWHWWGEGDALFSFSVSQPVIHLVWMNF